MCLSGKPVRRITALKGGVCHARHSYVLPSPGVWLHLTSVLTFVAYSTGILFLLSSLSCKELQLGEQQLYSACLEHMEDAVKALGSNDPDEQKRTLDVKEKTSLSSFRKGSSCTVEI